MMLMASNEQIVKTVEQKVKEVMRTLPRLVGNEVVNFSKENFRRQGFLGNTFEKWPARKVKTKFGITPRNNGRAILVDTAKLKRATRVVSADWNEVIIGNDVPYAQAHNEGISGLGVIQTVKTHRRKMPHKNGTGAIAGRLNKKATAQRVRYGQTSSGITFVKEHKRKIVMKIPRRRFIGNSPYLNRNIQRLIASQIQKAIQ
jgi:phage gpG-like protein